MNGRRWLNACLSELRYLAWCVIGVTLGLLGWFSACRVFWWVYRETWVGAHLTRTAGMPRLLEYVTHHAPWDLTVAIMATTLPWVLGTVMGIYVLGLGRLLASRTRVVLAAYVASYWLAPVALEGVGLQGHWLVTLVCVGLGLPSCRLASWLAGGTHAGCRWFWQRCMG